MAGGFVPASMNSCDQKKRSSLMSRQMTKAALGLASGLAGALIWSSPALATAPEVTSLSPNNGGAAGGTVVSISGEGFLSGATVKFGGVAATSVIVNSFTSITATSAAGSGTVNVSVTDSGGTSTTGAHDQFAYNPVLNGPWLGLNLNSAAAWIGEIGDFAAHNIVYDRGGQHSTGWGIDFEAGEDPTSGDDLERSIDAGMIPVISIEYDGYFTHGWGSDSNFPHTTEQIASYATEFVKTATAIRTAYPGRDILFQPMNEPWGNTTPNYNGTEYADVIAKLLPEAETAGIPLKDIYVDGFGADLNTKEEWGAGWVPAMYEAQPGLETAIQGWSFVPEGPTTGTEFNDSGGIEAVPAVRELMLSGENNIIIAADGYCSLEVDEGEECREEEAAKTNTQAAEWLNAILDTGLTYHEAGWLKALIVRSRSQGGFSMQLPEDTLTKQGEILDAFADTQPGEPDTTPPSAPSNFDAMYESEDHDTTVSWNPSTDPPLPDGHPGSGLSTYSYRYRLNSGSWSSWESSTAAAVEIPETTEDENIAIEAKAEDVAGNTSTVASAELVSEGPTLTAEDLGSTAPGESGEVSVEPEPEGGEEGDVFSPDSMTGLGGRLGESSIRPLSIEHLRFERLCGEAESPCGEFKGAAAAAYAQKWSLNGESDDEAASNHDPEYGYFGGDGGDCTNFVSQALHAGGMQFMRAHGDDSPDGDTTERADAEEYENGEGSWWSYYLDTPFWGVSAFSERTYTVSAAFVRAHVLQEHLIKYGLGRFVKTGEPVRPGDVVFYDLGGPSLEYADIDHAQFVTRVTHKEIWVAQHTKQYEHTLAYVADKLEDEGKKLYTNWRYDIVEPIHTAADSGESDD
jgi:hypothetical protein